MQACETDKDRNGQLAVDDNLSYRETAKRFEICSDRQVKALERIYLTEGSKGISADRRWRKSTGRSKKLSQEVEDDLLTEVQRLRAKNEYFKNLQAVVLEDELCRYENAGSSNTETKELT